MTELNFPILENPVSQQSARDLRQRIARHEVTERRRMTQRLREALATDGFALHYQPIITLGSGFARGAETLLRLRHSRRGYIPAQHFMPVAERSGVITSITGWVLHEACRHAATWPAHFSIAMALSLPHLQSGRLIHQLLESLNQSGVAPERLELEITEPALQDGNNDTVFALKALQGLGVRLALNNFGTCHASLSALKRLPFSTLRLDRSLVQNLEEDSDSALVRAAIKAGHALGQTVLAGGVENETQYQLLMEFGADEGQGPYFGQPVGPEEMAAMFALR
ncbi:MAG: EAL domain-containing protein [Acidocella sp.]|uniref:EAL domain-containing protein n=1 Tax=Acidocella sp. TaxID=50710 RepID=UPI003FD8B952